VTLRARLVLAFVYVLLLTLVALAIPLALTVERRARSDFEARLGDQARVISASIAEAVAQPDARRALEPAVSEYARELDARVIVTDADGMLLADSTRRPAPPEEYASRPEVAQALEGERVRLVRHSDELGTDLLFLAVPIFRGDDLVGVVRLSQPTSEIDERVGRSRVVILVVAFSILVAGSVAAWALASSLARPLGELAASAERLGEGDLDARAPERGPPEVRRTAEALNRMAEDLSQTLQSQRDFVANASHQLRTPLTGIRLRLEAVAAGAEPGPELDAAQREVDRLGSLIDELLLLARASAQKPTGRSVDLAAHVREAAARWRPRAEEQRQTVELSPADARAWADPADVAMVLDNLLENALVHGGGSRVRIEAFAEDGSASVAVEDDGTGIPAADVGRVLDRFYRGRNARTPGTGLGLAIVRELAERWDGEVDVRSGNGGTRVTVRFRSVA
jgi:two-component system, OmpR family, sensor kinase